MKRWAMSCLTDGTALVACQMKVEPSGDWVEYADHLEALAAKDAEIAEFKAQLAAVEPVVRFLGHPRAIGIDAIGTEQFLTMWMIEAQGGPEATATARASTPAAACAAALERMK